MVNINEVLASLPQDQQDKIARRAEEMKKEYEGPAMNVLEYVKQNYNSLPKSSFNDEEVVIVFESGNENYGWGNHSYSGYGVDAEGKFYYCFSSGCSCHGSCGAEHEENTKKFEIDPQEFPFFHFPEKIDYIGLETSFSDY